MKSTKALIFAAVITSLIAFVMVASYIGCTPSASSETEDGPQSQREATEQLHAEANRQVGMPDITNFQELRFAKMIQELRDTEITTYTYMVDVNGNRHFICQSVGFGLPYSTQMTSPEVSEYKRPHRGYDYASTVVPQPEPNGLYLPDNVDATWILCLDPEDDGINPVYSEPELLVSPFKMH